jgi:hypothetical protein
VGDGVIVFSTVGAGGGAATVGGGGGGALVVDTVTLTSVGVMMVSLWFNHHLFKLSMADGPIGNCPTARKFLRDTAPHVA